MRARASRKLAGRIFVVSLLSLAACSAISGLNGLVYDRGGGGHGGGGAGVGGGAGGAGGTSETHDAGPMNDADDAGEMSDAATGEAGDGSGPPADGGDGGGMVVDVQCTPGTDVAVGVAVQGGAWLDRFALLCSTVSRDGGPPSTTVSMSATAVGGQGGVPQQLLCPAGQVVVEFQYAIDSNMAYQVWIGCQTPADWKATNVANPLMGPAGGGPGGMTKGWVCPAGHALSFLEAQDTPDGTLVHDFLSGSCLVLP